MPAARPTDQEAAELLNEPKVIAVHTSWIHDGCRHNLHWGSTGIADAQDQITTRNWACIALRWAGHGSMLTLGMFDLPCFV